MLKSSDNALLTDPAERTPMGRLLRHYWVPALMSSEVRENLCAPVRVTLLGESLVAFRGADGIVGVVQEACAHRCSSLFYGRNEEGGIRCIYHGWKYDRSGQCIEQPTEPPDSTFYRRIKIKAYPVQERAGLVWIYMGDTEEAPELPQLEWLTVPADHVYISKRLQECNYLQALEGGIDSSHASVLHQDTRRWHREQPTKEWDGLFSDTAPRFYVEPTDYGLMIGARRDAGEGKCYWRITQWLMPWYTLVPRDGDRPINAHAWVPIDATTTWSWSISYHPDRPLSRAEVDGYRAGSSIHAELQERTFRPVRNRSNDYLINRDLQRTGYFSGIEGVPAQDCAVQESMGDIVDRSREHLGTSDAAIIAARRRLLHALRGVDAGASPPATNPSAFQVRSAAVVLPVDVDWTEAVQEVTRIPSLRSERH